MTFQTTGGEEETLKASSVESKGLSGVRMASNLKKRRKKKSNTRWSKTMEQNFKILRENDFSIPEFCTHPNHQSRLIAKSLKLRLLFILSCVPPKLPKTEEDRIKKVGDPSQEMHSENPQDDGNGSHRVALRSRHGEQPVQAGAGVWRALPGCGVGTVQKEDATDTG